jgi:hypothetical protein
MIRAHFLVAMALLTGCDGAERTVTHKDPTAVPDAATTRDPADGGGEVAEGPRSPGITLEHAAFAKEAAAERRRARLEQALTPSTALSRLHIEQHDIATGRFSVDQIVDVGRGLFTHAFSTDEGLGNALAGVDPAAGMRPRPNFRRFQEGHFGGPETTSCVSCHWKGGEHGAGDRADNSYLFGDGETLSSHDARNPPALLGLGWVQMAAEEMTQELWSVRNAARAEAMSNNQRVVRSLEAKGVSFGQIAVHADGTIDDSGVEGVDRDLVIRPFGWKGTFSDLRSFVETSLQVHFGIQAESLLRRHLEAPIPEKVGAGTNPQDPDNDGVLREFTDGQLTAVELFLATLEVGSIQVSSVPEWSLGWLDGADAFEEIGCASCHRPYIELGGAQYRSTLRTSPVPAVDLERLSAAPRPVRDPLTGRLRVYFFSDFKRHDVGEALASRHVEADVPLGVYLTRRLWGLSRSSPYMHDGCAATFDDAILAHDGEARAARQAFESLSDDRKAHLRVYLLGLTRQPHAIVR